MNKKILTIDVIILIALITVVNAYVGFASLTAQKTTVMFGLTFPAVTIWFSLLTFPVTDIITNEYGRKVADFSVLIVIFTMFITFALSQITVLMPSTESFKEHESTFNFLLKSNVRYFIFSSIGFGIAQLFDNRVFIKLKELTNDRHLWVRNNVSTIMSQALGTIIFYSGIFIGILSIEEIIKLFLSSMVIRLALAFLDTPLVYLGVHLVRKARTKYSSEEEGLILSNEKRA